MNVVVASIDAWALFPSLRVEDCMMIAKEMLVNSKVKFVGTDWKVMAEYIAEKCSDDVIKENKLVFQRRNLPKEKQKLFLPDSPLPSNSDLYKNKKMTNCQKRCRVAKWSILTMCRFQ